MTELQQQIINNLLAALEAQRQDAYQAMSELDHNNAADPDNPIHQISVDLVKGGLFYISEEFDRLISLRSQT